MTHLELFFIISFVVQVVHSLEELTTGFHKKWYLFKMPFWVFLSFEIVFTTFWLLVFLLQDSPQKESFQAFFLVLMFANGIQHIVWFGNVKKYVPGLITGVIHVIIFLFFYFQ